MGCPRCGLENAPDAKFCTNCGTQLAKAPPAELEERKIVTAMFVELAGLAPNPDADPEDVKASRAPFFDRTRREIERYGGTVDKFMADGVFGVFGAPVAHEDDPERSLWAAFRILRELEDVNRDASGPPLRARIGINTGEAVVAYGAGPQIGERVTGDVVNTASRLQSVAPEDGIVVGEATYRATRSRFVFDELPPVAVKGKSEPVAIFRPVQPRSRSAVAAHEAPRTPFVGRDVELSVLKGVFQRAVRESAGQLVTVTGEAGVGKSRLVGELFAHIDGLTDVVAEWRQGRCLPYGEGVTFWALSEIVKSRAGILDSDAPQEATAKLAASVEAAVEDPGEADWIAGRLAPLVGLSGGSAEPAADRSQSFAAWRRFFESIALIRPLILVFDDLHWADPALLEFLKHVMDWSSQVPLLFICVARPELYAREPRWGGGKRNSTTISLGPLSQDETARLLQSLLDRAVLPAHTQSMLLDRAGGNPLYAEEFVRMLADQGILEDGDEGHEVRPAGGVEIPVPPTVQALIAARIDTLSPQRKALLLDAAIVGRTFWSGAVASISGLDEATVVDELHEIVASELIRPHRMSQVKDQQEYSFWHLLVRDVAHGLVPRALRAEKHRAAARWLEGIAGDRVEDHAEELAHHSMSALSISRTLGETGMPGGGARELEADAVRFLLLSGDRASRLDVGRAESFYRRALELIPPGDPQRGVVLAKAAESAASAGRFAESERDYDEAFDELRGAGDARALGRAMAIRARTLYRVVDTVRGLQMSDEAVRMLKDLPPNVDLVMALTRNAGMLLLAGENATCLEVSREAVELAERLGAADEVVRARQFLGAARCELGDAGGMADLREAVRLGLERGLAEETGVAYSNLANQSWLHESPVVGRDTWTQAMEFCEVRGFTAMAMWARTGLLESLLDLGEWDEALAVSERLLSWDRERGGTQHGVFAMAYRAEVFVRRGAVEAATELMDEFLPRAREVSSPLFLAPAAVIAARIELERGDPAAAAACVDEYAAATEDQAGLRADHLPEATRILIAAGRGAAGRLAPSGDRVVATRRRHCLVTAAAALSEAAGDLDAAAAGYADAARRWDAYGHQLERALALGGLGRVLPPLGRTKEANAATTDSRALLESLGVPNDQVPGSVVRLPSEAAAPGLKE